MLFSLLLLLLSNGTENPSRLTDFSKVDKDRDAILAMAGTYAVSFHFQETIGFPLGYQITEPYDSSAMEIVIVVEETPHKIVLQHVLQTKKRIVKHWRQDWVYENRELLEFQGNLTWRKRNLTIEQAKGTWTQRVFQVDDSPRYESYGQWRHEGNYSHWESEETNRPLPRREYSKRDDYDILVARNRQTLTLTGWAHEQDNFKLRSRDGEQRVIAREFGLNSYNHTNPRNCAEAERWWQSNRPFWAQVREAWQAVYDQSEVLTLAKEVDGKPLYRHLFDLGKQWADDGAMSQADTQKAIHEIIHRFRTRESL